VTGGHGEERLGHNGTALRVDTLTRRAGPRPRPGQLRSPRGIRERGDCPTRAGTSSSGADTLLTLCEVLAELKVARSTFDTWRTLGPAPECIKLPNGQIRVRRRALDAWIASRTDMAGAS
jgi:predicted DNA-binding transcriptional regulator AlpA